MFNKKNEKKYVVRHHIYVSVDRNMDTKRENKETKSTKSIIIFEGTLDQCKRFVKIQLLDALTTLIDLDEIRTELRSYSKTSYEGIVNVCGMINDYDELWFNSSYKIEQYETWMDL